MARLARIPRVVRVARLTRVAGWRYDTIRYDTTLFNHASHTQQKLVSRWGVGKHVKHVMYVWRIN